MAGLQRLDDEAGVLEQRIRPAVEMAATGDAAPGRSEAPLPMWVSGIMQGLMWRSYDSLGFLQYSFIETVAAMHPYYVIRAFGGVLFLSGALIMVYNLVRTTRHELRTEEAQGYVGPARGPAQAQPAE